MNEVKFIGRDRELARLKGLLQTLVAIAVEK